MASWYAQWMVISGWMSGCLEETFLCPDFGTVAVVFIRCLQSTLRCIPTVHADDCDVQVVSEIGSNVHDVHFCYLSAGSGGEDRPTTALLAE